ncbi:hypothetical protein EG328_010644 [Venturia inaequalis]|uniref:Uncharacterized protein n=1 Tax=Venturia inaequalis TaxID=5025 RepID=A0A8H3Z204_VENIN|nr:hypothetical protein EG328_010644 [Venturia inaequalis]KAE9994370.1 hypothetical protein EG327_010810 [Venturia inaequalis]
MEAEDAEEEVRVAQVMEGYGASTEQYRNAEKEGKAIPCRVLGYCFDMYHMDCTTNFHLRWTYDTKNWCSKKVEFNPSDSKDWDPKPVRDPPDVLVPLSFPWGEGVSGRKSLYQLLDLSGTTLAGRRVDTDKVTHMEITGQSGPIHPTIDPRRWETERPSEIGHDPHGPPLPMLDNRKEEDSREESELWREEDLVHGMDIAFAAPGVPPFNVRVRGRVAPSNSSNAPGMIGAASEEMATDIL